jgi:hypothetical protein
MTSPLSPIGVKDSPKKRGGGAGRRQEMVDNRDQKIDPNSVNDRKITERKIDRLKNHLQRDEIIYLQRIFTKYIKEIKISRRCGR